MKTLISHQQKSKNNSESPPILLESGPTMVKSNVSDPMEQKDSIPKQIFKPSLVLPKTIRKKKEKLSVMQESAPPIKEKTLKDKSCSSKKSIQKQKSTKILDQDSTGKDQVLIPFWNQYTKEISQQLWSPIGTDFVDLGTNSLNGSSKRLMSNSWFSARILHKKTPLKNSQKTFLQSQLSLLQEIMVSEQDNIDVKETKKKKALQKKLEKIAMKQSLETSEETEIRLKKEILKKEKDEKTLKNKELKKEKTLLKGKEYYDPCTKEKAEKSIKIQVYFTPEQIKILNKWFGVTRYIYNKCLTELNINETATLKELRSKFINVDNYNTPETRWMLEYNYDLRDEALRDLLKNKNSNLAKGKKFKLKYKSKKNDTQQSISILSKHWNKNGFFGTIFNPSKIKTNETLPEFLPYSSRLIKTTTGKYFICMPLPLGDNQTKMENKETSVIFIDPGSKCFITGYDPSGKLIVWGENDVGRIGRLLHYRRKLRSKISTEKTSKKRKRMRIADLRIGEKIDNLVQDLHKKLAKWLCENYTHVFLPRLNFHTMKKLYKKEKSKIATLSHCAFSDRVSWKSREYNCRVFEVQEDYTSKTCSNCGFLKGPKDIIKDRTFVCDSCDCVFDRDMNASKNIMLKYLSKIESRDY
jgi:putative transposase